MSVLPHAPSPTTVGRAIVRTGKYYSTGLAKSLFTLPVFIWAQAIAFKVFITLLPLILLATGVFGLVLRQDQPSRIVTDFLRDFLPAAQSEPLVNLVLELQGASGGLTFIGAGAFLITVITLFSTLRYVIGMAMGGDRHQMRSILKGYVFDGRMLLQVGSLFLVSFALTLGTQIAKQYGAEWGLSTALVDQFGVLLTNGIPYAITVGMIVQLYYFIPRPHPPGRSAMWGAAVAAVLFEAAKNGFALYATYIGRFDRYAAASGETADSLGGLGGAFGLLLAFVFWVYLSGLILVVGAVVTTLHEKRHRPRRSALRRLWKTFGVRRRHSNSATTTAASGDGASTPEALPASASLPHASVASGAPETPPPPVPVSTSPPEADARA